MRDRMVIEFCSAASVPVAIAKAGGHAGNIPDTVDIHFASIRIAAHRWRDGRCNSAHVRGVDLIFSYLTGEISSLHLRFGSATGHFVFQM